MATATLISYPSALCLAGNISPVRVSAAGLFTFRLKKGSTVLLEEDYVPDASGQAEIDIRDIILADLSLSLPDADVYKQASASGSYTLTTDTDSKSFRAVLGGIDRPATDAATFLEANFLTWQPQIKSVAYNQPEWLSFYVWSTQTVLKARFYLKGGTTSDIVVAQGADFDPNCIYSVNVQFSRIWSLGTGDRYGMFDVWVEDGSGKVYTYTQRYVLDASGDVRTVLVARNSLGGIDTFSFHGDMERAAEADHTNVMYGDAMLSGLIDLSRTYTVNTGILSRHERDWVWDLQRSTQAWVLMDGALRPVVMLAPTVTASMLEDSTGTVDFRISDDTGYLNIQRIDTVPGDIEIPGPDGEVFFLAPRLVEFPDAVLDASLLLPVQSPFSESWSKLSVSALSSYLLSQVDEKYESLVHTHDNLSILNKFSVDSSGRLLFDGEAVGGDGGITDISGLVTLATEQTITAKKTFAGDVVLGGQRQDGSYGRAFVPSHAGPGVFDLYISSEPIAGEIPSGSGGIDETELWSILGTSGTQQIDASHMSSALAGYATRQWVQQQGYLTSSALTPYATKEWVEQQGYLKSVNMSSVGIHASWQAALAGQMPDYATSDELSSALNGYYTSDEVDDELAKYVTLSTEQTVSGKKTFSALLTASGGISGSNADLAGYLSAAKLYVPSYNGNKVYDLYVSNEPIAGEAPSGSGGLDEAELWSILTDGGSGERIAKAHLPLDVVYTSDISGFLTSVPKATASAYGGIKTGFPESGRNYPVELNSSGQAYVSVPWVNTTYNLSSFGITATADEINKLDGVGTLLHSGNIGSYALTPSNYTSTLDSRYLLKSTYTAADVLAKIKTVDGAGSGLDADLLDGVQLTSLASAHHYLTNAGRTTGYYKILINSTAPWMLYFRIRLYQSYNYYDIDISGYNYHSEETNYSWYMPKAKLVSSNVDSVKVYFGHDSANKLWVAVPAQQYTGLAIYDVVNGYNEISKFNAFTISYVSSLSGTTDSTQTCYRGASINDNVASATKLQTARTLWGQSFDGTANISGGMSGVGNISFTEGERIMSDSGFDNLYIKLQDGTVPLAAYNTYISRGSSYPNVSLGISDRRWSNVYSVLGNFSGLVTASSGVQIGSTDDIGWYNTTDSRICAGQTTARGVNVGSLLVSDLWADYTKVPTNGIYSKGDIWTGGRLYIPSYNGNQVYDLYVSNAPIAGEAPSGSSGIDEAELWSILTDNAGGERIAKAHLPLDTVYEDDLTSTLSGYAKTTDVRTYTLTKSGSTITLTGSDGSKTSVTDSNTTYSLSSFGITATAAEINKLDGVGTLLHSGNIGSYALTPSNYTSTLDSRYLLKSTYTAADVLAKIKTVDGSGSGLDADLLDGVHLADIFRVNILPYEDLDADDLTDNYTLYTTASDVGSTDIKYVNFPGPKPSGSFFLLTLKEGAYRKQIYGDYYDNHLYVRSTYYSGGGSMFNDWSKVALTTDNVASATKLQTSRTLWGQSFNGTANVSGGLTGATFVKNDAYYIGDAVNGISKTGALVLAYGANPIYFYTNSAQRMIVDASGNVGIGTTAPAYKLDVAGTLRATSRITAAGLTSSASIVANAGLSTTTLSASGAATLSSTLSVSGAATLKNGLTVTGTVTATGNIIAYSSSSRLVKDIVPKRTTFSQRLTALGSVVDYRYNNVLKRDKDAHIGLIYENVRDAMPGMCHTHEGYGALNYLDTDYINLIAGSVQEHTDEITHLKNRVAMLEAEVTRLRRGLAA